MFCCRGSTLFGMAFVLIKSERKSMKAFAGRGIFFFGGTAGLAGRELDGSEEGAGVGQGEGT